MFCHLGKDDISPLVGDLILGTKKMDDFDEESESVDMEPVIEIAKQILSNDLATHWGTFMEGTTGLNKQLNVICNKHQ